MRSEVRFPTERRFLKFMDICKDEETIASIAKPFKFIGKPNVFVVVHRILLVLRSFEFHKTSEILCTTTKTFGFPMNLNDFVIEAIVSSSLQMSTTALREENG